MDAREREESQVQRSNIIRPWEEETSLSEQPNPWHGTALPPIGTAPDQSSPFPPGANQDHTSNTHHAPIELSNLAQGIRYEGHGYGSGTGQNADTNTKRPASRSSYTPYDLSRTFIESPRPHSQPRVKTWGKQIIARPEDAAGSLNAWNLCRQCKRLTTPSQDMDTFESCEDCKRSPELGLLTKKAADALTQLAETLSAIAPEQLGRHPIRVSNQTDKFTPNIPAAYSSGNVADHYQNHERTQGFITSCPPLAQFGLKPTLDWILDKIYQANELAGQIAHAVPSSTLQPLIITTGSANRSLTRSSPLAQDEPPNIMKRRISGASDMFRSSSEDPEPMSDLRPHKKPRSLAMSMGNTEELLSLRSGGSYPVFSADVGGQRATIMNPPPAPSRQLPSPPGRALPSPTSATFPSPSSAFQASTGQPLSLPSLPNIHSSNTYLPPISPSHSSDALQAHTAALQHEVSVQKIAMSSLQGEHDKLLAAFSRSQTRAVALEKKHAVSDTEIITLSEEKLRLQGQVVELERDIEEIGRSRDEYRQAAVQEGAQYVEIVKKASRLEQLAAEERKEWNKLKAEMEARIDALLMEQRTQKDPEIFTILSQAINDPGKSRSLSHKGQSSLEDISSAFSAKETILTPNLPRSSPRTMEPGSAPESGSGSDEELIEEVRFLRRRSAEMEHTLRAIQKENRNIERMVQALDMTAKPYGSALSNIRIFRGNHRGICGYPQLD